MKQGAWHHFIVKPNFFFVIRRELIKSTIARQGLEGLHAA
jgi:hypothetical protein